MMPFHLKPSAAPKLLDLMENQDLILAKVRNFDLTGGYISGHKNFSRTPSENSLKTTRMVTLGNILNLFPIFNDENSGR